MFCSDATSVSSIIIKGRRYTGDQLRIEEGESRSFLQQRFAELYGEDSFELELADFLAEWFSDSPVLTVRTSGSTGQPKVMEVLKERMLASACMTLDYLNVKEGQRTLLCMPLKYIAGRMVVVRAITGGLDLIPVKPSGRPFSALVEQELKGPHFAALVPLQVYNTFNAVSDALKRVHEVRCKEVPEQDEIDEAQRELELAQKELEMLQSVKNLIIGGGGVDPHLAHELQSCKHAVWSTYGMTETLSHIALRRINGEKASDFYTPLPGVRVFKSDRDTLVIHAPHVCSETLCTNDLAEFDNNGRFRIIGRADNTVITGGVKVQLEETESVLEELLSIPFTMTFRWDRKFGHSLVLLISSPDDTPGFMPDAGIRAEIAKAIEALPEYSRPKLVLSVDRLPKTETGKRDRRRSRILACVGCGMIVNPFPVREV